MIILTIERLIESLNTSGYLKVLPHKPMLLDYHPKHTNLKKTDSKKCCTPSKTTKMSKNNTLETIPSVKLNIYPH